MLGLHFHVLTDESVCLSGLHRLAHSAITREDTFRVQVLDDRSEAFPCLLRHLVPFHDLRGRIKLLERDLVLRIEADITEQQPIQGPHADALDLLPEQEPIEESCERCLATFRLPLIADRETEAQRSLGRNQALL